MFESLIIIALVLVVASLGILYLFQNLIGPHKLDSIKALLEAGKYDQAVNSLTALMKKDDRNPLTHLYLAEAYYFTNNFEMAMVEYKQVLSTGRFSTSVTEKTIRKRLADIYMKFGQLEEAQKEFVVLSKLEPHNFDYLFQIGSIFYDRGMKEQSLAYLDRALKSGKSSPDVFFL